MERTVGVVGYTGRKKKKRKTLLSEEESKFSG